LLAFCRSSTTPPFPSTPRKRFNSFERDDESPFFFPPHLPFFSASAPACSLSLFPTQEQPPGIALSISSGICLPSHLPCHQTHLRSFFPLNLFIKADLLRFSCKVYVFRLPQLSPHHHKCYTFSLSFSPRLSGSTPIYFRSIFLNLALLSPY